MSDNSPSDDGKPLDGDVIGPDGSTSAGPDGAAKRKRGPNKKHTPEERAEEAAGSKIFFEVVKAGGFDWRHKDWEPSEAQRRVVSTLAFCGYTHEDIGLAVGMSVETLQKHFDFELKTARMLSVGDLAARALTRARQGNDTMTIFLLKTRGGPAFSERAEQAAVLGDKLKDAVGVSDERKQEIISSIVDLLTPKRAATKATTKEGDGE